MQTTNGVCGLVEADGGIVFGQRSKNASLRTPQVNGRHALHGSYTRAHGAAGYAGTFLPGALAVKDKRAARELAWQWIFPAKTLTRVPATQE